MKKLAFLLLPIALALAVSGCATTESAPVAQQKSSAVLTGSYLPQPVNADGIADGANNVSVLTAEEIRNTGAPTVPRALNRLGYNR